MDPESQRHHYGHEVVTKCRRGEKFGKQRSASTRSKKQ